MFVERYSFNNLIPFSLPPSLPLSLSLSLSNCIVSFMNLPSLYEEVQVGLPRTNPLESCSVVLVRACAGGGASPVEGVRTWTGAGWGPRREGEEEGVGPGKEWPGLVESDGEDSTRENNTKRNRSEISNY